MIILNDHRTFGTSVERLASSSVFMSNDRHRTLGTSIQRSVV
jgi:hypothetical protein